ncbi:hypothetical protein Hanom_Chr07g00622271 [Helianthus anomalus]
MFLHDPIPKKKQFFYTFDLLKINPKDPFIHQRVKTINKHCDNMKRCTSRRIGASCTIIKTNIEMLYQMIHV